MVKLYMHVFVMTFEFNPLRLQFTVIQTDKYVDVSEYSKDMSENTVKLETQDIFADLIRYICHRYV